MPEIRVTRELPVPLTDKEKSKLGTRLCEHLREQDSVVNEKAAATAACNLKLKEIRKNISRVRGAIETGEELRDVQCVERPGLVNGTVDIVRLDTNKVIETITDDPERAQDVAQVELPLTRPGSACEHCGNADGTHRPDVAHGYARAELNVSKGIEKHERVIPLTFAQRDGLVFSPDDGAMLEAVGVEYEGKSYVLLQLVDEGGDALDEEDLFPSDDDDAPDNDKGAAAIDLLDGDVEDPDVNEPKELVSPDEADGIAPKKKSRKGKKDGAEPRVRA